MKGIDSNSSLLDNYNYDAQQIVDYIRDFAAFEGSMKGLLSIFLRMLMESRTLTVSCRMLPKGYVFVWRVGMNVLYKDRLE